MNATHGAQRGKQRQHRHTAPLTSRRSARLRRFPAFPAEHSEGGGRDGLVVPEGERGIEAWRVSEGGWKGGNKWG